MYYDKYLKYKRKYLQLKKQLGGLSFCEKAYKNILGTCWAVAIQMMLTFGQATSNDLKRVIESIDLKKKKIFIDTKIKNIIGNSKFKDFYIVKILNVKKRHFLIRILEKFIDRYYGKILDVKNPREPIIKDDITNKGRCELVIAYNFFKLFDYKIFENEKKYWGDSTTIYLIANLLSIFFLNHKVSFTNHYDNFHQINFDSNKDIGIVISIEDHYCCLYICDGKQKFYNDNNEIVYDCDWLDILKKTNVLYIEKDENLKIIDYDQYKDKHMLKKVLCLTVISKHTRDSDLDKEIKNIMANNFFNVKDKYLQYDIGYYYNTGSNGLKQNYKKAVEFYRKSAEQGYEYAQYDLANMLYEQQNYKESVKWYSLAADNGNKFAQYFLGKMNQNGIGIPINYSKAARMYRKSAIQDNKDALNQLMIMFEKNQSIPINNDEDLKLFHIAVENDNVYAQYKLGLIYLKGDGVIKNNGEAFRLLRLAADKGYIRAEFYLANMYLKGEGVTKNVHEAARLFANMAGKGNPAAQSNLGYMFQMGIGLPKNIETAKFWYNQSAKQGDKNAISNLERLERLERLK